MFQPLVLSLFLYFPEDKSEYGPAAVTFILFMIAALLTMKWIINISKREAKKAKELEEQIMKQSSIKGNSEQ
jgi:poly-D-alanine transfer protein DltD